MVSLIPLMEPLEPASNSTIEKGQYIILDTCVIQAAGSKEKNKADCVQLCLKQLKKNGYRLALSQITVYENLCGLWGERVEPAMKVLRDFEWKEIPLNVLTLASLLAGLYNRTDSNVGDQIIAATAILEDGLVFTENHKDFPNPYFTQKEWYPLSYQKGSGRRTMDLILYQPQLSLISRKINEMEKGF